MLAIYITAGYPSLNESKEAIKILDELGVDLIELGIPFSDPLADGPTIQEASHQALLQGVNLDAIFDLVAGIKLSKSKLILFSYYNVFFVYGFDKVIQACKKTNIQGILIPDLPVEEAFELSKKFKEADLDLILLASVTSTDSRLESIAEYSNPWIYLVSRTGITGASTQISNKLQPIIQKLKTIAPHKTIGLGFGIDSKEKVKEVLALGADMAIVGSKAIEVLKSSGLQGFRDFVFSLQQV